MHISTCDKGTVVGEACVVGTEHLRPDLVIQKLNDIIEVMVPFDNGLYAFTEARVNKINKYS